MHFPPSSLLVLSIHIGKQFPLVESIYLSGNGDFV